MKNGDKRIRSSSFVIESTGGVLKEEFAEVAPLEFKVKSRRERKREQEIAWEDFDKALSEKIRRGEFYIDQKTREVKR